MFLSSPPSPMLQKQVVVVVGSWLEGEERRAIPMALDILSFITCQLFALHLLIQC